MHESKQPPDRPRGSCLPTSGCGLPQPKNPRAAIRLANPFVFAGITQELVPDEPPAAALQDRRAPHPTCPVLRPPAGREPLDGEPLSADSPTNRAIRVAPHLSGATAAGRTGISSRERRHGRSDHRRRQRVAQALGFTGMTAVEMLGSGDELTDGTGGFGGRRHGGEKRTISEIPGEMTSTRSRGPCQRARGI